MTTPVVEILRVSTETQAADDRAGLPAQHATNLHTCKQYGLTVVATIEIVMSGVEVADTPEMARVLDLVRSGGARGVVLAEYSRLFRPDRWTDLRVLQTFADHDASIYLPSGPLDLLTEAGFVSASVNNMVVALERKRIRERTMRAKEEHRKRGAHVAGGVGIPFGLSYSRETGWAYTPDIVRVRELFRRFLAGERNYQSIGNDLGLARSTVRFVLGNPVYTGWRVYDSRRDLTAAGKRAGSRDRRKIARAPSDVLRVRLPLDPIISESDHAIVLAALDEISRRVRRNDHADAFAYRGHLVCDCGRQMYCNVNRFAGELLHYTYFCPSRTQHRTNGQQKCATGFMRREKLEPLLDDQVAANLRNPALLLELVAAHQRMTAAPAQQPADVGAQIRELERKRKRVIDLAIDGAIDRAERAQRLADIDRHLHAFQSIAGRRASSAPAPDVIRTVEHLVEDFYDWDARDRAEKLALLDGLHAQLHIGRYVVRGVTVPLNSLQNNHRREAARVGIAGAPTPTKTIYLPFREVA